MSLYIIEMVVEMEKLTVDKAIDKGQKMVNFPMFAILIIGFGSTFYFMSSIKEMWTFPIGFIATLGFMWLWWSIMITKWRLWAFKNCRNVHELKRRAIDGNLIWPDSSKFEKTEIRTANQKRELDILNLKFQIEDEIDTIDDDDSIPLETQIYYSIFSLTILWVGAGVMLLFGLFLVYEGSNSGYLLILISFFGFYNSIQKSIIKDPYVVINSRGIKTLNSQFILWENIENAQTEVQGFGSSANWYLHIELRNRNAKGDWSKKIKINDLNVKPRQIQNLIRIYEQRNRMSTGIDSIYLK